MRETREEVGIELGAVELLGEFVSEAANEPGHVLRSTVFHAATGQAPVADGEIAEVRWTDIARAAAGDYDDLAPMLEHDVLSLLRAP